jgi:hypothetical protein
MTVLQWQICLITAAAIAASLFPIVYTLVAPWWRSEVGRSLFISEVSLAALLDIALVAYWLHWTVPQPVATSLYTLIAVGAWLRLRVLIVEQIRKPRGERPWPWGSLPRFKRDR